MKTPIDPLCGQRDSDKSVPNRIPKISYHRKNIQNKDVILRLNKLHNYNAYFNTKGTH